MIIVHFNYITDIYLQGLIKLSDKINNLKIFDDN